MKQERDMWNVRFHALSRKHEELQLESKDKDALIELLEDREVKKQREPDGPSSSSIPHPSGAWKKIIDQLVLAKAQMTTSFESEIRRIRRKYGPVARSSDAVAKGSLGRLVSFSLNQSSPTPATPPQRTVISEVATSSVPVAASQSGPSMPAGFPWGMPPNFVPEGFIPTFVSMLTSSPIMFVLPLVVHTLPHVEDTMYHSEPSEGLDVYEKMDEMKDQFFELRKELKTLRGKDLFGKSPAELCLVPNVKIPMKFKVHDFEKYKGNTYPLSHLVMYARKMSTQIDNDQLLIHYFQDSLTSVALRWYMGLDGASVHTLNDLGEAFVKQYKYNMDMTPDRDQLRYMSQKDKEMFKEYA
ncbi:hypothetical protein KIW84_022556 [Lathyrus oleraceus]|uniref:Retrotransposon gag domain-containing protein n=1 Tax=Pisum sativum TaxID=3888 RepID=A0A9D5BA34_PEA|nr:hypothetical protein KIW84_022556 [Pisum sativum]